MLLYRVVRGRPRLFASVVAGAVCLPLLPTRLAPLTRGLLAWDFGCAVLLALVADLFGRERRMARDAALQEEGEWTVFAFTIAGVFASFAAMLGEFAASKQAPAGERGLHVGLVIATLLLSWLVTHTLFALRYAHEYYSCETADKIDAGLEFPGGEAPDYWDFFYFAIVLGMTFQVSDVQITSRKMRRVATIHGLIGFLFNTVVLALSVNLGAGLL